MSTGRKTGPGPKTHSHAELGPSFPPVPLSSSPHTCSTFDHLKELSFSLETELLRKSKCLVFKPSLCFKKAGRGSVDISGGRGETEQHLYP